MKQFTVALLFAMPVLTQAQTVVKRADFIFSNPFSTGVTALPIGFNVKDDGNIYFYWSQANPGTLKDGKQEDRRIKTLINNLFDPNKQEIITALPVVHESLYDTALKFISVKSATVSPAALDKSQQYTFNGKPQVQDLNDLPTIFPSFPYKPEDYPVTGATLSYTGKGLLGEKDKKYFPVFTGSGFTFTSYASPVYILNDLPKRKDENQAALSALSARKDMKLVFLPGAATAQGFFYTTDDADKYGEFKNYQFITWDKESNIINKEIVTLPFAYDPEGIAILNENQQGVGFVYLCKRSSDAKKAANPDETAYYILTFDAQGKLTASFETTMGVADSKIDMIAAFTNKGTTYLITQDRLRKSEKITVNKLSTTLEKLTDYTVETPGVNKSILSTNWSNVQWRISRSGNLYFIGQGVEKGKAFGMKTELPLGVNFMSLSPDFTTIAMQNIDFMEPTFSAKLLTIDILDERDENLNLALFGPNKEIAAAIVGPKKASKLAKIFATGNTIYVNKRNHFYDAATQTLYVITIAAVNNTVGEIVKVKY